MHPIINNDDIARHREHLATLKVSPYVRQLHLFHKSPHVKQQQQPSPPPQDQWTRDFCWMIMPLLLSVPTLAVKETDEGGGHGRRQQQEKKHEGTIQSKISSYFPPRRKQLPPPSNNGRGAAASSSAASTTPAARASVVTSVVRDGRSGGRTLSTTTSSKKHRTLGSRTSIDRKGDGDDDDDNDHISFIHLHFKELMRRQLPTGKIPAVMSPFQGPPPPASSSAAAAASSSSSGIENDSELLFVIAAGEFIRAATGARRDWWSEEEEFKLKQSARQALEYVELHLVVAPPPLSLVPQPDDLTTIPLMNTCVLYRAFRTMDRVGEATEVARIVSRFFWNGQYFRAALPLDFLASASPCGTRATLTDAHESFHMTGNALAVLYGLTTARQAASIFDYALSSASGGSGSGSGGGGGGGGRAFSVFKCPEAVLLLAMLSCEGTRYANVTAPYLFDKWKKMEPIVMDQDSYTASLYLRIQSLIVMQSRQQ